LAGGPDGFGEKQVEMKGYLKGLFKDSGDWLTLMLLACVWATWVTLLFGQTLVTGWGLVLILAPLLTLHSSLQHEIMHGHPFRNQMINDLLACISLGILVPYFRFKDTHLYHHTDSRLCDPYDDPESWYQPVDHWNARSKASQAVFNFNNTLIGRLLIGPAIGMTGFMKCELRLLFSGQWHVGWKWGLNFVFAAILLMLVHIQGAMSALQYVLAAYMGMSLLMVRTFIEHQFHEKIRGRSVIIESRGLFSLLFLNNNFHAVHHSYPGMAWYRLPGLFAANREKFLRLNDGYSFPDYTAVFRKYGLRRKENVPYPGETDKAGQE
jgi:fatty acid desaturase